MSDARTFPPEEELDRSDFLLTMSPLRLKGGTGCP